MLGGLGFENAYALAMPRAPRAKRSASARSPISRGRAPSLSIAGDYEFFGRPEWDAVRKAYGLAFREQRQMQPEFMYRGGGARRGRRDRRLHQRRPHRAVTTSRCWTIPSTRSRPTTRCCWSRRSAPTTQALLDALRPLVDAIDVTMMREANLRASGGDNASPGEAARWLWSEIRQKSASTA